MSRSGGSWRATVGAASVALAIGLSGCGVHGLTFVHDDRVDITAPADRATRSLPFELEWTARDLAAGQRFAVLVDRTPPPSGKQLAWLFRSRDDCKGELGKAACQQPSYLAGEGVLLTDAPGVTIAAVRSLTGSDAKRAFHDFTIVIVDATGRRIGEGAWTRQVEVES